MLSCHEQSKNLWQFKSVALMLHVPMQFKGQFGETLHTVITLLKNLLYLCGMVHGADEL